MVDGGEIIEPGTSRFQSVGPNELFGDGPSVGQGGCDTCGDGACGDCGPCDGECGACDYGYELFDGRCGHWLRDLSFFAGTDAFKGPPDRGTNGNFGLNEGLNLAAPLGDPWGCGYQIGVNCVQSNFSGAPTFSVGDYNFRAAYRRQTFVTAGLFHRTTCRGFQGGVAFDYLNDDYYEHSDLKQLRSETGYVIDDRYEIGYYGVYGVGTDRTIDGRLDPTDMFAAYIRRQFRQRRRRQDLGRSHRKRRRHFGR